MLTACGGCSVNPLSGVRGQINGAKETGFPSRVLAGLPVSADVPPPHLHPVDVCADFPQEPGTLATARKGQLPWLACAKRTDMRGVFPLVFRKPGVPDGGDIVLAGRRKTDHAYPSGSVEYPHKDLKSGKETERPCTHSGGSLRFSR